MPFFRPMQTAAACIRPRVPTPPPARAAGFTSATAPKYYTAAAKAVAPAVPTPDLRMSLFDEWIHGAHSAGVATDVDPLATVAQKDTAVLYSAIAQDPGGRRRDSCTAYLTPVQHGVCRHNLEVVQSAAATKILVNGGRATGVDYLCADSYLCTTASEPPTRRRLPCHACLFPPTPLNCAHPVPLMPLFRLRRSPLPIMRSHCTRTSQCTPSRGPP